ncbi:tRNA (guanine(9)-N(1))-methyltransferase [Cryptotrichosporon argae]
MSKSAQKRATKRARFEALKPLRRAAEKERKRERTAQLAAAASAGTMTAEQQAAWEALKESRAKKAAARKGESGAPWAGGVVVDLEFDALMTDQEIVSMASQLGHSYAVNRTAQHPFSAIVHTSFSSAASPRIWARMDIIAWERWKRCAWWGGSLEAFAAALGRSAAGDGTADDAVATDGPGEAGASAGAGPSGPAGQQSKERYLSDGRLPDGWAGHKLVYLSADADEELSTLADDEVYVIGGIVDRNRHKMLCQNKADKLGIRSARLPIGTFIENMPTRKVLTVNQVFAILVEYNARKDWKQAFETVIPPRKFEAGGRKRRKGKSGSEAPGEGEGEGEGEDAGEDEDDEVGVAEWLKVDSADEEEALHVDAAVNA